MEKKTNFSEEFGHLSNLASREFGTDLARLDSKTKLSPELNRSRGSDSLEFSGTYTNKEFSSISNNPVSKDPVPAPKPSRLEQHRHSLLLQMASVGLSVVLVTNSFGLDILGDNSLFTDSDPYRIVIEEVIPESRYDEDEFLETIPYVIYSINRTAENPGPYEETVRYDEASNTLYLDDCQVDILNISDMEEDLTIFVESTSYIALLNSHGTNITISGNQNASLIINQHAEETWWHGIVLYGQDRDVALTISPGITVDIYGGESAIAVDNTRADPGICFNASYTSVSGSLKSGDFPFSSGSFVEGASPDWTIVDDTGTMASRVIFTPHRR